MNSLECSSQHSALARGPQCNVQSIAESVKGPLGLCGTPSEYEMLDVAKHCADEDSLMPLSCGSHIKSTHKEYFDEALICCCDASDAVMSLIL